MRVCERCGREYEPKSPSRPTRFCGKACQRVNAHATWVGGHLAGQFSPAKGDTMKRALLTAAIVLTATFAQAGVVFVNVAGALVPCDHPIAVAAGLGCQPAPSAVVAQPATVGFLAGHFYVNQDNTCTFYVLSIARTYKHNAIAAVLERIAGPACPEPVYYYDPTVVPRGWSEVTLVWPAPSR